MLLRIIIILIIIVIYTGIENFVFGVRFEIISPDIASLDCQNRFLCILFELLHLSSYQMLISFCFFKVMAQLYA